MPFPDQLRIGVFLPHDAQFLDVAVIDVLGSMSRDYLVHVAPWHPEVDISKAPSISILYITSPAQGTDIPITSNATLKAHHVYTHPEVAPGKLDIVVVPGPTPSAQFDPEGLRWLREQSETPGVDVLSICTGILICAEAGIANGKRASGPRMLHDLLAKKFPEVQFVGDKRWVRDGNFWSSGSVTNGNDLVAAYALQSGQFDPDIAQLGVSIMDIDVREDYDLA